MHLSTLKALQCGLVLQGPFFCETMSYPSGRDLRVGFIQGRSFT